MPTADLVSPTVQLIDLTLPEKMAVGQKLVHEFSDPSKTDLALLVTIPCLYAKKAVRRSAWDPRGWLATEISGERLKFVISMFATLPACSVVRPMIVEDSFIGKTMSPYTRRYHFAIPPEMRPGPYRIELQRVAS